MKNKLKSKITNWYLLLATVVISTSAFAQAPVSWTANYEAGDNTFPPPATVNLKSIAYSPLNNDVYAYGPKFFNLPAQPSGNVYAKECGVVRFDNLTGSPLSSVYDVHHDNTTLIPHYDEAGEMAIGADGSVYVTGKSWFNDTYLYDMVVIKYSSDLVEQWRYYLFSPGAADDIGVAIAIEPGTGNIVAAGQIGDNGTGTGADFGIVKLTPAGGLVWSRVYNTSGTQVDVPADITVDSQGWVYVTGYSVSSTNGNQYTTIKYYADGTRLWTRYYNEMGGSVRDDKANSVAVDDVYHVVYVTGTGENSSGNNDIVTRAYDSLGTTLWTKKINNPGDSRDRGYIVKVDGSHNVYVAGDVDRDASSAMMGDLIYRKYDINGALLRTKKFNGSGYNCEFGDIAITAGGKAYLTGWCRGAVIPPAYGDYSLMAVKYNANGALAWSDFMTPNDFGSATGYYGFKAAINTATSEVAVGGRYWFWGPGAHPNQWLIRRYSPTLREGQEISSLPGGNSAVVNIYPNPAHADFIIETNQEKCSIVIVNMQGQTVYESKENEQITEINSNTWATGIYSVIINSNGKTITRKMVIE
jgi:hypothetical protein